MIKPGSAQDPLWYKDAVIYELHVRAFADSNGDGIGDFPGLMSRLDYLQDLGVTCIWLLPFMPSPLRDDGYDIANYVDVNPSYGTLADFKAFLDEAHQRGMQVMIELVINHTSDQHPWFKAARLAAPGSDAREMYVWSDTDQLYSGVRIIFTDTEKSNWTWDEQAKAFYWHRFFSHQPDLNFDHPRVMEEVLTAMRFWLDLGVDALRLDAIPYLIERDGTSCENVPETHIHIKRIREVIDREYGNRLILAEANMWPADVRPYFGDGDECHMAFHFPLMPRIYMALRQEDRLPITDIMAQTPDIPAACQWGLFLRNHDELTLEMVTDDERDYMNLAYASDARMRINVGIRRRLAPLVDNNRRRIELLNSLLLSFPGTPIMYYGDEIGMGDNIYLGDRNGVRTPMQWNSDRNAGFSKADPARLYFPLVMDPIYGYQVVNVEAQLSDQSSLLHWTRNMIALRKLFQVFGRGTLTFLHPENRKVLAYLRDLERLGADGEPDGTHETVLCVANLSRFAQPVALDLAAYAGQLPVEMLGYVPFPPITAAPYVLSLAPYSFLWFELQPAPAGEPLTPQAATETVTPSSDSLEEDVATQLLATGLTALTQRSGLALLQSVLPAWLTRQRWFGAKTRAIISLTLGGYIPLQQEAILLLDLHYADSMVGSDSDRYVLTLAWTDDPTIIRQLQADSPRSILAMLDTGARIVLIYEASVADAFRQSLLQVLEEQQTLPVQGAQPPAAHVDGCHSSAFASLRGDAPLPARTGSAEQSNTNFLYGRALLMKLFRRLQPGINPDCEIGRFLTEVAHFPRIAPFLGELVLTEPSGEKTTLAMLQGLVENEGDGWAWALSELAQYCEAAASCPPPLDQGTPPRFGPELDSPAALPHEASERAGLMLEAAALLGRRTAEMHLALATPTDDPAFAAEPLTPDDLAHDALRIDTQINHTLDALKAGLSTLQHHTADAAALVLSQRIDLFARAHAIAADPRQDASAGQRIRIHGDYHLGQILRARNDFVLLDFEGEPARTLEERRQKQSPLRDVAGMLRSISYVAAAGLNAYLDHHPDAAGTLTPWVQLWENAVSTAFLHSYRSTIGQTNQPNPIPGPQPPRLLPPDASADRLLSAYLLEKALYELLYELNNRPAWLRIPLAGLLALTAAASQPGATQTLAGEVR